METLVFRSDSRYLYETDATGRRIIKFDGGVYFLVYLLPAATTKLNV